MNISYCLIGFTFLFSSVWMSLMNRNKQNFIDFYDLLDAGQKNKYEKIVIERLMIYLTGMFIGLAISYYYYSQNKNEKYLLCKALIIGYTIKLGFYYLFPKSPLMLYSLRTKEQTDAWADIYSEMKNRWITSLTVGFFGYVLLSYSL